MIDWERIAELREEIGAEDLAEVMEMFLEEVGGRLEELKARTSDQSLAEDMHFLKSSALNIGFAKLADICSGYEVLAASDSKDVDVAAIEACYAASCEELRTHDVTQAA